MRQLDPGSGKTKHAYLWAYRSNALDDGPSVVVFDYQTSRAAAHARAFLQDWRGHSTWMLWHERDARGPPTNGCASTWNP